MNKYLNIALLSVLFSSAAYAGDCCRPVLCCPPEIHPYIGLEANYTWTQIDGFTINVVDGANRGTVRSNSDTNGWGGRLYAGALRQVCGPIGVSAEMGYGYYGNTKFSPRLSGVVPSDFNGFSFESTQSGLDLLAGIVYNRPCYDLFFKVGGLVQNSQIHLRVNEGNSDGLTSLKANQTEVMPVIRLGGAYHVSSNVAITAAWMHAFGSDTKVNVNTDKTNGNDTNSFGFDLRNPTQDTVSLGLLYCI